MPTRTIKMRAMPLHLENRFVTKWGYAVEKRVPGEFVLFRKKYISDSKDTGVLRTIRASVNDPENKIVYPDFKSVLTEYQRKTLEQRCDNIVHFFPDPYAVPDSVRARLQIIMQRLTTPEAQFVQDYMDENFPIIDEGK